MRAEGLFQPNGILMLKEEVGLFSTKRKPRAHPVVDEIPVNQRRRKTTIEKPPDKRKQGQQIGQQHTD